MIKEVVLKKKFKDLHEVDEDLIYVVKHINGEFYKLFQKTFIGF